MASLFVSKPKHERTNAICNGGLGGFVEISQIPISSAQDSPKSTVKSRKIKKRPPPIVIPPANGRISFTTTASTIKIHKSGITSPFSPLAFHNSKTASLALDNHSSGLHDLRPEDTALSYRRSAPPLTPVTPTKKRHPSPVELPDTPVQTLNIAKRLPPTPPSPLQLRPISQPLSTPISIFNVVGSDQSKPKTMERLKHLSSPEKRTAAPKDLSENAANDMSLEQLLQVLPSCNQTTIRTVWIPAVATKHKQLKDWISQAGKSRLLKIDASLSLVFEHLKHIDESSKDISNTYKQVTQEVAPLAAREISRLGTELRGSQKHLEQAQKAITENKTVIKQKDCLIQALRLTKDDQANVFIDFIQQYAATVLDGPHNDGVPEITALIHEHHKSNRIENQNIRGESVVRVPETKFIQLVEHNFQLDSKLRQYRAFVNDQADMIRAQSRSLDERLEDFGKLASKLAEQNSKISALEKINQALDEQNERLEADSEAHAQLRKEHTQLLEKYSGLEATVKDLEKSHKVFRDEKETELAQKAEALRLAEETIKEHLDEHLGRSKDSGVRHIATMIQHAEPKLAVKSEAAYGEIVKPTQQHKKAPPSSSFHWYSGKGSSFLPWKNKSIGCGLPMSQSMVSLSTVDVAEKAAPMHIKRLIDREAISAPMSPRVINGRLSNSFPTSSEMSVAGRPRSNSVDTVRYTGPGSPLMDKSLPSTPPSKSTSTSDNLEDAMRTFKFNSFGSPPRMRIPDPFINAPVLHPSPSRSPHSPIDVFAQGYGQNKGKGRVLSMIESEDEEDVMNEDEIINYYDNNPSMMSTLLEGRPGSSHTSMEAMASSPRAALVEGGSTPTLRPQAHPLQTPSNSAIASTSTAASSSKRVYRQSVEAHTLLGILDFLKSKVDGNPGHGGVMLPKFMDYSQSFRLEDQRANGPQSPRATSTIGSAGGNARGGGSGRGSNATTPTIPRFRSK